MKNNVCKNCGSNDLIAKEGYLICEYCHSKYIPEKNDLPVKNSTMTINDDIKRLLHLMKTNPSKKQKYAKLILDIDPTNLEVKKYI